MRQIIADCEERGLLEELRVAMSEDMSPNQSATRAVRDLVYELASSTNRDLVVDVMIHATGIGEFGRATLASYARRHGLSLEGFRKHVVAMQGRLGIEAVDWSGS